MKNNRVKIKIQQIYAGLRPSEQKVADYILEYEGKASKLLMETLAQETGVSQPTVIRFVKAAGYEGFKDFKYALVQEEAKEQPEDSDKISLYGFQLSKKDRLEDVPGKIVTTSIDMLEETLNFCGSIGLTEFVLTCDQSNIASARVIQRCGGRLEAEFYSETFRQTIQRYRISR